MLRAHRPVPAVGVARRRPPPHERQRDEEHELRHEREHVLDPRRLHRLRAADDGGDEQDRDRRVADREQLPAHGLPQRRLLLGRQIRAPVLVLRGRHVSPSPSRWVSIEVSSAFSPSGTRIADFGPERSAPGKNPRVTDARSDHGVWSVNPPIATSIAPSSRSVTSDSSLAAVHAMSASIDAAYSRTTSTTGPDGSPSPGASTRPGSTAYPTRSSPPAARESVPSGSAGMPAPQPASASTPARTTAAPARLT